MESSNNFINTLKLPKGYSYKVVSGPTDQSYTYKFRVKEVNDEATAIVWILIRCSYCSVQNGRGSLARMLR